METAKRRIAACIATVFLAACGGGGDSSSSNGDPRGLWIGTTSTGRTSSAIVLGDGTYYVLYSAAGNPSLVAGVVQGSGAANGNVFSSSNAKDFGVLSNGALAVSSATLVATFTAKQSLAGTLTYSSGNVTFNGGYDSAFEATPTLTALAGSYSGTVTFSVGTAAATATISTAGGISGSSAGCSFAGTATPRTDANAFNIGITFGASPCVYPGQTVSGIGYYNSATKQLLAALPTANRTDAFLVVATKP